MTHRRTLSCMLPLVGLLSLPAIVQAAPGDDDKTTPDRRYGVGQTDDANVPSFYLVPMKGQMGTDIRSDIYEQLVDDIRTSKPDIIILVMECADYDDKLYNTTGREETGMAEFDDFRTLVNLFRDDLREFRQVMWVHDSVGVSSMVAMAWDELYMKPDARFGGMAVLRNTGFDSWKDDDVRGKMTAAFMAWARGFLENGNHAPVLADAMIRPQFLLSATFKGREVEWTLDDKGEFVVDSSDKATLSFRAKDAEDLLISDGTANDLDDLALLLGVREYRIAEGKGEDMIEGYVEEWRRTLENAKKWLADAEQHQGWAQGDETLKWLGKTKTSLERVVAAMKRHKAVEIRLGMEYGVTQFDLESQIAQIKEQIRRLKRSDRGRGGGGASGRGGSGGGGIGGRGGN